MQRTVIQSQATHSNSDAVTSQREQVMPDEAVGTEEARECGEAAGRAGARECAEAEKKQRSVQRQEQGSPLTTPQRAPWSTDPCFPCAGHNAVHQPITLSRTQCIMTDKLSKKEGCDPSRRVRCGSSRWCVHVAEARSSDWILGQGYDVSSVRHPMAR